MIFALIIACALSFIAGFVIGNVSEIQIVSKQERKRMAEIEDLRKELKNFLEYDGSEQI